MPADRKTLISYELVLTKDSAGSDKTPISLQITGNTGQCIACLHLGLQPARSGSPVRPTMQLLKGPVTNGKEVAGSL